MKKMLDFIKRNRTALLIIILIFAVLLVVFFLNNSDSSLSTTTSYTQTNTEKKLSEILSSISGVGNAQVMISEGEEGIEGVVIVCAGGNNIMTKNDILNAVSTALNIEKNIIAVYAMN
jgi:hypothetical protein